MTDTTRLDVLRSGEDEGVPTWVAVTLGTVAIVSLALGTGIGLLAGYGTASVALFNSVVLFLGGFGAVQLGRQLGRRS